VAVCRSIQSAETESLKSKSFTKENKIKKEIRRRVKFMETYSLG
jgi:hypothetical protein